MKLEEILSLEGIVIRLIPKEVTRYWRSSQKAHEAHKASGGESIIRDGRELMVEHKTLSLGGKYLITFAANQDSMVRFDLNRNGIGNTIEEAYSNYLSK